MSSEENPLYTDVCVLLDRLGEKYEAESEAARSDIRRAIEVWPAPHRLWAPAWADIIARVVLRHSSPWASDPIVCAIRFRVGSWVDLRLEGLALRPDADTTYPTAEEWLEGHTVVLDDPKLLSTTSDPWVLIARRQAGRACSELANAVSAYKAGDLVGVLVVLGQASGIELNFAGVDHYASDLRERLIIDRVVEAHILGGGV